MTGLTRALSAISFLAAGTFASAQVAEFVPGEVLVKFRSTNRAGLMENAAIRAKQTLNIPRLNVQRIKLPSGMSTMDGVSYYQSLAGVEYAEPNYKKTRDFVPNDPRYSQQWGQKKIQCESAWNISKGAATVIIAVIDDGTDLNHEDQKNKLVPGYDFSDNDNDPTTNGDHGTHCAGIAAAETNNGKGVAGTGFNCKIMPLKIFPNATDAVSATAIIHAADNGAKVLSMSYGSYAESQTEKNAVNYAWGKGCVLVSSAGNLNTDDLHYPSDFPNVISVGSTNTQDRKSDFSNYGADRVDVAAPGEDIMSTVTGGYANNTGTSMACPMVSGVVGLLWGIAPPGTTNVQIRNAIESTTDPVVNNNNFVKFGRVNAFKAVKVFDNTIPTVVSPASAVSNWFGTNQSGGLSDIQASDANFYEATTVNDPLGQVAGAIVEITFNGTPTNLRSAQVVLEANGATGATNQVYLWSYTSGKYNLIKASALYATGTNLQKIALPTNLTQYVSAGKMRVGLRAIGPKRSPRQPFPSFVYKINAIQIETKANS